MRFKRFVAVLNARNKEFLRDRSALAWNLAFPVLIVFGFAFALSGQETDLYKVGVYPASAAAVQAKAPKDVVDLRYVQYIATPNLHAAVRKVEHHQLDMLIDPVAHRYWINDSSPKGYMLEHVLFGGGSSRYAKQAVSGRQVRYVDWLMPGILGMNMMFSALFGVGYVIVRYRKNGVLKRLKATPLTPFEFLTAQVVSRVWLILLITAVIYVGTDWLVNFAMFGSYWNLVLVFALGAVSLVSLGLVVAARIASEELAGGLLNLISWPMMFLSGVWFSLEGTQAWVKKIALLFPLTHVIDAARAVMFDGAGLWDITPHLLALTAMTVIFLAIGSYLFRWE